MCIISNRKTTDQAWSIKNGGNVLTNDSGTTVGTTKLTNFFHITELFRHPATGPAG